MSIRKSPRPAAVDHVREEFLYQIKIARDLADAVKGVTRTNKSIGKGLSYFQACRATELAFMAVCAAWEDFLEGTMIRYLVGAKAPSGYSPALRCGMCDSIPHAYQVLAGNPDYEPAADYMTWTNPEYVMRLAQVFFVNGEPFTSGITPSSNALKQAPKIRNRVAHASQSCKADFKKAANVLRQRDKKTSLGRGFRVGYLLVEAASPFFGKSVAGANVTVFEAYMRLFEQIARAIVPG